MRYVRSYLAKLAADDRELQAGVAALDSVWDRASITAVRALLRGCAAALRPRARAADGSGSNR